MHRQHVVLAKRDLATGGFVRRQRNDVIGGKLAFRQNLQEFATDIAGRTDYRDPITHDGTLDLALAC